MKRYLKLLVFVLLGAVIITVTKYETFSSLCFEEWSFISTVFSDVLSRFDDIIFWKYVIVVAVVGLVLVMGLIRLLKNIFRKKPKQPDKPTEKDKKVVQTKVSEVKSTKVNTGSPGKFKRV